MDSGYSWIILFASFCTYGLVFGTVCSFGVYFVVLIEYFDCQRQQVALVGGLAFSAIALAGPAGDFMYRKFGARTTVITGGLVACTGHVANFLANSIQQLAISNAIVGAGMGLTIVSSLSIQPHYFQKFKDVAVAFVPVGTSVGLFIFPQFMHKMIQVYTWRGSMLINAGLALQIVVCGALLRQPKNASISSPKKPTNICRSVSKSCRIFADPRMVLFCLTAAGWTGCSGIFFPFINDLAAKNTGLTTGETTSIMVVCGVCDLVARVSASVASHFKNLNRELMYAVSMLTFGLATVFSTLCSSLMHFYITAGLFGLGFGFMISVFGIVASDLFGSGKMSTVIGFGNLFGGIGCVVMPLLAGILADLFGQQYAFYVGGAAALVLGSFCGFLIVCINCRSKAHANENMNSVSEVEMKIIENKK